MTSDARDSCLTSAAAIGFGVIAFQATCGVDQQAATHHGRPRA